MSRSQNESQNCDLAREKHYFYSILLKNADFAIISNYRPNGIKILESRLVLVELGNVGLIDTLYGPSP